MSIVRMAREIHIEFKERRLKLESDDRLVIIFIALEI